MIIAGTYGSLMPPLFSEHGGAVDSLIIILHWFMILFFIGWGIFFTYCLVRFRRRPGKAGLYRPVKASLSKYLEVGVIAFEAFLLIGLSMPVWADYKNAPPTPDDRIDIRVIAEQFQWNFHYPGKDGRFGRVDPTLISASNSIGLDESDPAAQDDAVTINDLHLPVGKNIYLRLSSKDVIHSFFIPTMRLKQDIIPGSVVPVWFKVKESATTEAILEDMTERFQIDEINWYRIRHHVAAEDHLDSAGMLVLAKGDDVGLSLDAGSKTLARLRQAGVTELVMHPRTAFEVVCAQLCGSNHFKMKAQVTTHTLEDFESWLHRQSQDVEFDDAEEDFEL